MLTLPPPVEVAGALYVSGKPTGSVNPGVPLTKPVVGLGPPVVAVPALGTKPNSVSTSRNTPHTSAPSGLAGATGVFTPSRDKNPPSRLTTGLVADAGAAASEVAAAGVTAADADRAIVETALTLVLLKVDPAPAVAVANTAEPTGTRTFGPVRVVALSPPPLAVGLGCGPVPAAERAVGRWPTLASTPVVPVSGVCAELPGTVVWLLLLEAGGLVLDVLAGDEL